MVSADRNERLDPEPAARGLAEVPPIDRRLDGSVSSAKQSRVASPVGRRTRVTRVLVGGISEHSVPGYRVQGSAYRVRGSAFGVRARKRRVIVVGVSAPRIDLGCSATGLG